MAVYYHLQKIYCLSFLTVTQAVDCTMAESLERCYTTTPDKEDPNTLTQLISHLDRKKNILADLDKDITARINEEKLESEVLEFEELHSDISSTVMKGGNVSKDASKH